MIVLLLSYTLLCYYTVILASCISVRYANWLVTDCGFCHRCPSRSGDSLLCMKVKAGRIKL